MTRSVAEDKPPGRRKHHCSNNGTTRRWHTLNECYTDPRASTPCDEAEPPFQHPLAMPYVPHLYAARTQHWRRQLCSWDVNTTRNYRKECAHVRQRWAPQITEQCDVLSEPSVHVAFDEPQDRCNVSVALSAYAPQTARVNPLSFKRQAPDYIRRASHTETRSPFQKKGPCVNQICSRSDSRMVQHPNLSPEQQRG